MKVVLLTLSGDESQAREALLKRYPAAEVVEISRAGFEKGGLAKRLRNLRQLRPDVFAVATERLAWQRAQDALLLFGALAGARSTIILDAHGASREETRSRSLVTAPARLAGEAAASTRAMMSAAKELRQLERSVAQGEHVDGLAKKTAKKTPNGSQKDSSAEILYLRATPGPGTQLGGAASHINGFINAAKQLGARLSVVSNDQIAGLDEHKTPLKIIWPKPVGSTRAAFDIYNNLLFTQQATTEIEKKRPDFIYQRYSRFTWAGVTATLHTKRPLFLEYNGSEVWVGRHWDHVGMLKLLERYERLNLAAATRIFVVSEVERRNLERAGVARDKIIVNPNGVDTELFQPGVGGERVRSELRISDRETLVGFVGSFGPWHGALTLAEAIKLIPETSSVRFLLVGAGSLLAEVKRVLKEDCESGRVILTGSVEHEQVPVLLDACDVLVSPHVPLADGSEFFGSPTKIFEYMAMGKGIVASRLGQIGEVLTDQETALLVEPGNALQLSEAIARLAESPALRQHLGAEARMAAIQRHTWKRNAQTVLDAYGAWLSDSD